MRNELEKIKGKTTFFTAIFTDETKTLRGQKYYLIKNLRLDRSKDTLSNHLWLPYDDIVGAQNGDVIKFKATVESYIKGYWGKPNCAKKGYEKPIGLDYQLTNVEGLKVIFSKA